MKADKNLSPRNKNTDDEPAAGAKQNAFLILAHYGAVDGPEFVNGRVRTYKSSRSMLI